MIRISISCIALLLLSSCTKQPAPAPLAFPVVVTESQSCTVPLYVEYVGHVVPYNTVKVYSQVEGTILTKYFNEGQAVQKGDPLFTIDPRPYEAALLAAEGSLLESLANFKIAREKAERYSHLIQDDYVSQFDYDQYVTQVMVTEAIVKQTQANLDTAKINLNYCSIQSPIEGITGLLQVDVGNLVTGGTQQELITINQIMPIYTTFTVPERDLTSIRRKACDGTLKTLVYLSENKEKQWSGTLNLIDNQVNQNTGSVLMRAVFPNTDRGLWPGQFVVVRLILGEQKNALLLPSQAVMVGQNGPYVFVVTSDNKAHMRSVVKGQIEGDQVIILSGVSPGEQVVLQGQLNLYDGALVTIKTPPSGGAS